MAAAAALRRLAHLGVRARPAPVVVDARLAPRARLPPVGRVLARRCFASEPAETSSSPELSTEANSYISLGAFETMGGDVGRMATGIAYLEEAVRVQEAEHAAEEDPRRRANRGMSLAQSLLQVGRQHHQQQDPHEAISHYQRALSLVEEAVAFREGEAEGQGKARKALEYARFILSEICSSVGVAYNDVGRREDAVESLQRALALRKETVGTSHPAVAECLNNIGALYFSRGSLQKAAEHYEQALDLLVAAAEGRQEGAYVALTLYNIGVCRSGLGQMEASVTALKRALRIAEQALGSEHRQVELIRETLRQGPPNAARAPPAQESGAPPDTKP